MKNLLLLLTMFLSLSIFGQGESQNVMHLKKNVAFVDAGVRSISSEKFVKEIVLINFSRVEKLSSSVTFQGVSFFDDGSYNDTKANDGIYTSAADFNHSSILPFVKLNSAISVMDKVIVDHSFSREKELTSILDKKYTNGKGGSDGPLKAGGKLVLKCDAEFGTCGCNADSWGLCNCCCVTLSNCSISIGW